MSTQDWYELLRGFNTGTVDRREFVTRAFATGASAGAIAAALAGGLSISPAAAQTPSAGGGPILPDGWVGPLPSTPAKVTEEPVTLRVVVPQRQQVGDWATNAFTLWYEERTGVHLEFQEVAGTADEQRAVVNAMIAGGDLPDIFLEMPFNPSQLLLYGSQGLFIPLNDLIEEHGVLIKQVFAEYPSTQQLITSTDGNIYAMPDVNDCYHCRNPRKLWINQEWLDAVGLAVPQTTDELLAVYQAFKEQDPNGDGSANEIPLMSATDTWVGSAVSRGSLDPYFMGAFLYNPGEPWLVLNAEEKVDFTANKDAWREGLKFLNQLYADGFIAPETFSQIGEQLIQVGNNPDVPILGSAPGGYWGVFLTIDQNTEGARWEQYVTVPPLAGPDGTRVGAWDHYGGIADGAFVVTNACQTPDIAVKWADGLYELEAVCRAYAGVLGEDWRWAEEGEIGINGKQGVWKQLVTWASDAMRGHWWDQAGVMYRSSDFRLGEVVDPATPTFEKPLYEETLNNYFPYAQDQALQLPPLTLTEEQAGMAGEIATTITNHVNASTAQFITGGLDPNDDGAWNDYIGTLDAMGLAQYLEVQQQAYEAKYGG
jgi:putative aldouronate transport system substrate-binding protein